MFFEHFFITSDYKWVDPKLNRYSVLEREKFDKIESIFERINLRTVKPQVTSVVRKFNIRMPLRTFFIFIFIFMAWFIIHEWLWKEIHLPIH